MSEYEGILMKKVILIDFEAKLYTNLTAESS